MTRVPLVRVGYVLAVTSVTAIFPFLSSGCGKGGEANLSRYTPGTSTSREALDRALAAWQRGEEPDEKVKTSPAVEIVDSTRQAGRKLASYEITGEVAGETPKRFSVRLKLEDPAEELEARYVVVGRDPIWVYREEDYALQQGM